MNDAGSNDAGSNAREFFSTLEAKSDPSKLVGIANSYLFEIAGEGRWLVDVRDGKLTVTEDPQAAADATFSMSRRDLRYKLSSRHSEPDDGVPNRQAQGQRGHPRGDVAPEHPLAIFPDARRLRIATTRRGKWLGLWIMGWIAVCSASPQGSDAGESWESHSPAAILPPGHDWVGANVGPREMPHGIRGAFAAALTPLRDGGEAVDDGAVAPYVAFLADGGVDGILALGTTGEGILFSLLEHRTSPSCSCRRRRAASPVAVHCGAQTQAAETPRSPRRAAERRPHQWP